jgi:hypothetical protein
MTIAFLTGFARSMSTSSSSRSAGSASSSSFFGFFSPSSSSPSFFSPSFSSSFSVDFSFSSAPSTSIFSSPSAVAPASAGESSFFSFSSFSPSTPSIPSFFSLSASSVIFFFPVHSFLSSSLFLAFSTVALNPSLPLLHFGHSSLTSAIASIRLTKANKIRCRILTASCGSFVAIGSMRLRRSFEHIVWMAEASVGSWTFAQ